MGSLRHKYIASGDDEFEILDQASRSFLPQKKIESKQTNLVPKLSLRDNWNSLGTSRLSNDMYKKDRGVGKKA